MSRESRTTFPLPPRPTSSTSFGAPTAPSTSVTQPTLKRAWRLIAKAVAADTQQRDCLSNLPTRNRVIHWLQPSNAKPRSNVGVAGRKQLSSNRTPASCDDWADGDNTRRKLRRSWRLWCVSHDVTHCENTKAQVYECLAYYEDHRGEIDLPVRQGDLLRSRAV